MTKDVHKITAVEAATRYTPGHLLAPFGWAAGALGAMVEAEPTLLFHLFELDRARMHLIAMAYVHLRQISISGTQLSPASGSCCEARKFHYGIFFWYSMRIDYFGFAPQQICELRGNERG